MIILENLKLFLCYTLWVHVGPKGIAIRLKVNRLRLRLSATGSFVYVEEKRRISVCFVISEYALAFKAVNCTVSDIICSQLLGTVLRDASQCYQCWPTSR